MTTIISGTSGLTFPDNSTQAVGFYGFKNRIINGSTLINQRGVTSGVTSGYFVDRWQVSGLTTSSLITTSLPNNFTQAISLNRTSAAGTMTTYQNIESKNCLDLVGATVTVSFWAQNVTGITSITATLNYANTVDTFSAVTAITTVTVSSSPSASWTYYTATYTNLPSGVANGLQLVIAGVTASTGTLGVTGVQLEKGSTATSFDYRPYGTELALCQRYYQTTQTAIGYAGSTSVVQLTVFLNTPTRTIPTIGASTSSPLIVTDGNANFTQSSLNFGANYFVGGSSGFFGAANFTGLTQFRPYILNSFSGSPILTFSAEL